MNHAPAKATRLTTFFHHTHSKRSAGILAAALLIRGFAERRPIYERHEYEVGVIVQRAAKLPIAARLAGKYARNALRNVQRTEKYA